MVRAAELWLLSDANYPGASTDSIGWINPSSRTVKSALPNPRIARPALSVTTTSSSTNRELVRNTGVALSPNVADNECQHNHTASG